MAPVTSHEAPPPHHLAPPHREKILPILLNSENTIEIITFNPRATPLPRLWRWVGWLNKLMGTA
jgi:hypothetical protein